MTNETNNTRPTHRIFAVTKNGEKKFLAADDRYMDQLRASARRVRDWVATQSDDPLDLLRRMKFDPVGYHPIEDRSLNFIEQINQTRTFAVALAAARQLLALHPDVGGFRLAPGAHASIPLDIMSEAEGQVGAETFAAVTPRSRAEDNTNPLLSSGVVRICAQRAWRLVRSSSRAARRSARRSPCPRARKGRCLRRSPSVHAADRARG